MIIERAPVTLSISLESAPTTGNDLFIEVKDPKLSTIRQRISDLLKGVLLPDTQVPAKAEFLYEQVHSQSQMDLFVQTDVSYGSGGIDTAFDWSESWTTNKIMVKYKQIYYSIDIDYPPSPSDFFDPSLSLADIEYAVPAWAMPIYVAGVSYGMMAIMCIETNHTEEQMGLALVTLFSQYTLKKPVLIKQRVKILVDRAVCTKSDDEGSGNDADMDDFKVAFNAYNRTDDNHVPGERINTTDWNDWTLTYNWHTSGDVTVSHGYVWNIGESYVVEFDLEDFSPSLARIDFFASHREWDDSSASEYAEGTSTVYGADFLAVLTHKFNVTSADAGWDFFITMVPLPAE